MTAFRIEPVGKTGDHFAIMHGAVRAAVIYPAEPDGSRMVYPWPRTYPDLAFTGLPAPLKPGWETFANLEAIEERLGLVAERAAA